MDNGEISRKEDVPMEKIKTRKHYLDDDVLYTNLRYDEDSGLWFEDYVDFETVPRYTPNGRRWRSVTTVGCPYADPNYGDCGTCPHLVKEEKTDLMGVCFHEDLRVLAYEHTPDTEQQ